MSEEPKHPSEDAPAVPPEEAFEQEDDPAFAALLKRSLGTEPVLPGGERELLRNVQRKLRERSRGKFYGDGWSTTHSRLNYALIALVMLAMIVTVYLALGPTALR